MHEVYIDDWLFRVHKTRLALSSEFVMRARMTNSKLEITNNDTIIPRIS